MLSLTNEEEVGFGPGPGLNSVVTTRSVVVTACVVPPLQGNGMKSVSVNSEHSVGLLDPAGQYWS